MMVTGALGRAATGGWSGAMGDDGYSTHIRTHVYTQWKRMISRAYPGSGRRKNKKKRVEEIGGGWRIKSSYTAS